MAVALVGIFTGLLYRSELTGFNTYRLPPSIIRFSKTIFVPLIGSLHPPRRTNRAAPDTFSEGRFAQNDEIVTTAPMTGDTSGRPSADGEIESAPDSMQEWVEELRGRVDRANVGLRVPSQEEISHLSIIFPSMEREAIVGALQRR